YHTQSNGWSDIGYNFLVDRFGRLWEGRYGGITKAVMGAHTGGFNVDTFAVSAIGNYDKVAAPAAMTSAISRLLAWKLSLYYRDPAGKTTLTSTGGGTSRYSAGQKVTINVVSGHRDVGYTSCPGTNLYAKMATIRSQVRSLLGAGLVAPSVNIDSTTINAHSGVVRVAQTSRVTVTQRATGRVIRQSYVTGAFTLPLPRLDAYQAGLEAGVYDVTMTSKDGAVEARPFVSTTALTGSQGVAGATTSQGLLAVASRSDKGTASVRLTPPGGVTAAPLDLGGGIVGAPAVAATADGRIVVAGRGTNDIVYLRERAADGTWTPWIKAVGPVTGRPAVVATASGQLQILGRGVDGALWRWTRTEPGVWGAGERVGGLLAVGSAPAAAEAPTGGVHVVVQGTDHAVWYTSYREGWSAWRSVGGAVIGDPSLTAVDSSSAIVSAWAANSRPYIVTVTNSRGSRWGVVPNLLASTSPALVGRAGADPVLIARSEPTHVNVTRRSTGGWSSWTTYS
ncbi:MAG: N-acetylmuramoyl-L-alanine amidase, partial [Sporichthyaceae bacterium]